MPVVTKTQNQPTGSQDRPLLIVAHGSPSDPEPQEEFLAELARNVRALLPERQVACATLAYPGALETAVANLKNPIVYPHFMSEGWFVSSNLPRRLGQAGVSEWVTTQPLGLLRDLPWLALERLRDLMDTQGLPAFETTLVLAAHGSPSDLRPAYATREFSNKLKPTRLFKEVRVGFVDEAPSLKEAATLEGPAIVLPFFAARAGHVVLDLPQALEQARFNGSVMEPIGLWAEIPGLVAKAVTTHKMRRVESALDPIASE